MIVLKKQKQKKNHIYQIHADVITSMQKVNNISIKGN